jgi:hypothetical protein
MFLLLFGLITIAIFGVVLKILAFTFKTILFVLLICVFGLFVFKFLVMGLLLSLLVLL